VEGRVLWSGLVLDPAGGDAWSRPTHIPPTLSTGHFRRYGYSPVFLRFNYTVAVSPDGRLYRIGGVVYGLARPVVVTPPIERSSGGKEPRPSRLSGSVESYDLRTGRWRRHSPLRQERQLAAAAFGPEGKLYVFGGYGHKGSITQGSDETEESFARRSAEMRSFRESLSSVEVYDPATDRWEPRASMPQGLENAGAARGADGRLYVVGGDTSFSDPRSRDEVWVYDPCEDTWYEGPSLLQPRHGHAVIADPDGRIWVTGGVFTPEPGFLEALRQLGGSPSGRWLASVEMLDTRPFGAAGFRFAGRQRSDPRGALDDHAEHLDDTDARTRLVACQALGRLALSGDERLVKPLRQAAADSSAGVRACALEVLGRMHEGARSAAAVVEAGLQDDDAAVRWAAVEAWLRVARPSERTKAVGPLLAFLRDDDREVRLHAVWGLERVGPGGLAALRGALNDADHPFPAAVVEGLEAFGEQAAPALVEALDDTREVVREAAAGGLLLLAPNVPELSDELARNFNDDSALVRINMALSLARIGERSRPILMAALDHPRWDVRCSAAWALGELSAQKESVRALRSLAERGDPDKHIARLQKRAACEALARLGESDTAGCAQRRGSESSGPVRMLGGQEGR